MRLQRLLLLGACLALVAWATTLLVPSQRPSRAGRSEGRPAQRLVSDLLPPAARSARRTGSETVPTVVVGVVLHRADATADGAPGGELRLSAARTVPVLAGRSEIPERGTLLTGARLAGEEATIPNEEPAAVVHAWQGPGVALHVLDASTGEHLRAVWLARHDPARQPLRRPDRAALLIEPRDLGSSPLRVPTHCWGTRLWVGSPGFGWVDLALPERSGRPRVVLLERGATLEVDVRASSANLELTVHDREGVRVVHERLSTAAERRKIEALAPGSYRVALAEPPGVRPLVSERVDLVAGEVTGVLLEHRPARRARRALTLVLRMGDPLELVQTQVDQRLALLLEPAGAGRRERGDGRLRYLDEMDRVDGALRQELFLPIGVHEVELVPLGGVGTIEVRDEDLQRAELRLPRLAETRVEVVGLDPGQRLEDLDLTAGRPTARGYDRAHVALAAGHTAWVCSLPGELAVFLRTEQHGMHSARARVTSGTNELTLTVTQSASVHLRTRRAGAAAPMPGAWWGQLRVLAAGEPIQHAGLVFEGVSPNDLERSDRVRVWLDGEGTFDVELPGRVLEGVRFGSPPVVVDIEVSD